ncbi:hypothetical protein Pfo_000593 [Paulownia fortunei]|nr:hypothetical protein Pfo_000593 [Paulownia fortunei]
MGFNDYDVLCWHSKFILNIPRKHFAEMFKDIMETTRSYGVHQKPAWLEALYVQKFFGPCSNHDSAKKNEKNICCLDCCISICPHCIRRYVYHEVVRLEDLQKLMDCSNIQAYTINAAKVVFIKKRPQNRQFKESVNCCTSCDRNLQEPFIHCSLGCKVDFVLKHYKDLSPFLRVCKTLHLSPDFFIPQDMGDDEQTNEIPHSKVVVVIDSSNKPLNMSFACTEFVRKKRRGMYVCGRLASKIAEEDMATSISRRKGIPHRSPLC